VVCSILLAPQPTCRRVFMLVIVQIATTKEKPLPLLIGVVRITNYQDLLQPTVICEY
jgi:hypothetical protein